MVDLNSYKVFKTVTVPCLAYAKAVLKCERTSLGSIASLRRHSNKTTWKEIKLKSMMKKNLGNHIAKAVMEDTVRRQAYTILKMLPL